MADRKGGVKAKVIPGQTYRAEQAAHTGTRTGRGAEF